MRLVAGVGVTIDNGRRLRRRNGLAAVCNWRKCLEFVDVCKFSVGSVPFWRLTLVMCVNTRENQKKCFFTEQKAFLKK